MNDCTTVWQLQLTTSCLLALSSSGLCLAGSVQICGFVQLSRHIYWCTSPARVDDVSES